MGKYIIMQPTVDWVYSVDKNAALRFENLGIPKLGQTQKGTKYYAYEDKQ